MYIPLWLGKMFQTYSVHITENHISETLSMIWSDHQSTLAEHHPHKSSQKSLPPYEKLFFRGEHYEQCLIECLA